jgi:lysophospholipase L1-like esterase
MKNSEPWGVAIFFLGIYLAIYPAPKVLGHENSQAYIVLGESTDAGVGSTVPEEKGWASLFHEFLESSFFASPADLHNHAVSFATAGDILRDQLAAGLSDIASHHPVVVSLGGGGNDLLDFIVFEQGVHTCSTGGIQCVARFNALLMQVEMTLDLIVQRLRAAGPSAPILLRSEFNPFLKDSCGGPTSALAQLANLVLEGSDNVPFLDNGLNDRIRDVAARHNAKVIEVFSVFASDPNRLLNDDCIHSNDAGHEEFLRRPSRPSCSTKTPCDLDALPQLT